MAEAAVEAAVQALLDAPLSAANNVLPLLAKLAEPAHEEVNTGGIAQASIHLYPCRRSDQLPLQLELHAVPYNHVSSCAPSATMRCDHARLFVAFDIQA